MRQLVSQIAIMPDGIVVKLTLRPVSQTFSTRHSCKFISNIRFAQAESIDKMISTNSKDRASTHIRRKRHRVIFLIDRN